MIGFCYADVSAFIRMDVPWIRRGASADFGTDAGVFAYANISELASYGVSFRVVLAI